MVNDQTNTNTPTNTPTPTPTPPPSTLTDTSLCTFDRDNAAGSQFNLLFTPDMSTADFKLNASNPGQFYYNVFSSSGGSSLDITLPYPWVTQGAVPIHVYDGVTVATVNGHTCFVPGTELANSSTQVTLSNHSSTTVNLTGLPSGWMYINIHLDYGLKGTAGWKKGANNSANNSALGITIPDLQSYTFSDSTPGSATVQSKNVFKKDPGIAGLVLKEGSRDPVPNVQVKVYSGSGTGGKLLTTVNTDVDGWYMWAYKYTGKPATFTVNLPAYNQSQTVTLKSNGFLIVNFTVP